MNPLPLVIVGCGGAMVMMAGVWFFARRMNNAGIVDVWWAFGFAPLAVFYGVFGSGHAVRNGLIAAMVCAWSLRLGLHLHRRVMGHHPVEDPRYQALRERFPRRTWTMFLGFFLLQGLLIGILSLPVAVACANPLPGVGVLEIAGVLLWLTGIGGEAIADQQLAYFKSRAKGRVCDLGLWRYSRHPNYFFEWVVWISYAVFAIGSPWGWTGLLSPLLMLFLLVRVTGIPPAEARLVATRGEAYLDYRRRTSAFVPWFPKS